MSPTMKRVLSVTSIILCGFVILLSASVVIGVWVSSGKVITAGTRLITGAEKAAGAVQAGLTSIDDELGRLEDDTQTIIEATAQLSQNISDKGLILVLLPPASEEKLVNTVASIKDAISTTQEMLSSFVDTYRLIDSIPFVDLPKPETETLESITVKVEKLNTSIDNVRASMQDARDNAAGAAQKVSDAVGEMNAAIAETRTEVDARSEKITVAQASLSDIKESIPFWVYLGATIITLFLSWIIYTQVLIIQFAVAKYKAA
jgi:methyl-accepting chemotaxis protein